MRLTTLLATFSTLVTVFAASAPRYDRGVLVAHDNNYEDVIYNPEGKYSFINYYRTKCSHCNKLGPIIEIVADIFNGTQVQIVQLDGKVNKRVRRLENIVGFPTMRLFGFDGTHVGSFNGERNVESIAQYIQDNTGVRPNWPEKKVIQIESNEQFDSIVERKEGDLLIAFIAPWLEDWNTRFTQFDRLAIQYAQDENPLKFLQIDVSNELNSEILSAYRITKYPSLVYYNTEDNSFRILDHDTEDLNYRKFQTFIEDKTIGDSYSSFAELHDEKETVNSENEGIVGNGYGFNKDDHDVEEDVAKNEERFRRLREL